VFDQLFCLFVVPVLQLNMDKVNSGIKLFDEKVYLRDYRQREDFEIRSLEWPGDYEKGICEVLNQLSSCKTDAKTFEKVFRRMCDQQGAFVVVAHSTWDDSIIGCGTVFIEPKFLHGGKTCAHIEDIVVSAQSRGHHVGQAIIESLLSIARHTDSYKVVLNCTENNIGFYQKCDFSRREIEMAIYF